MINESTLNIVGVKCRYYRENILKESQSDFAKRHDISKQNINNFEAGRTQSGKILFMYVKDGFTL